MDDEELGLAHRHVRLAEPTPRWVELYAEEAERLGVALGHSAVIEHCGSTSVPGMPAKPLLDILIGLPVPIDVPGVVDALAPLGYTHAPHAGVPGHEVFGRGDPRTHLIHVVPLHGPAWQRMLRFRDALRADSELAAEYALLKRALAGELPKDRPTYTDRKAVFIARVLGESNAPEV